MMTVGRKLKIFAIITFIGVVLMTVSFVSPGWANVTIQEKPSEMSPFFFRSVPEDRAKVHMSAGLWYFIVCFHDSKHPHWTPSPLDDIEESIQNDDLMIGRAEESERKKCHVTTYFCHREAPFMHSFPNSVYKEVKELGKHGLIEFQIISSLGMFFGVLGFIGNILYARSLARSRCSGLLACISLIISGGTYIAAVVKTVTVTESYKLLFSHRFGNPLYFHCPWALTVGGIGGILVLISAVAHLCILSRNKRSDDVHVYHIHKGTNQGIFSQHTYTTIAPPGYTAAVGLKVPLVNAVEVDDGAGPLPEKK